MPRPAKGSEEAKAWGEKMKNAREAKKKMKGGMIETHTHPDGTVMTGKKHTSLSKIIKKNEKSKPSTEIPKQLKKLTKGRGIVASAFMSEEERRIERLQQSLNNIEIWLEEAYQDWLQEPNGGTASTLDFYLNNRNRLTRELNSLTGIVDDTIPTEFVHYYTNPDDMVDRASLPWAAAAYDDPGQEEIPPVIAVRRNSDIEEGMPTAEAVRDPTTGGKIKGGNLSTDQVILTAVGMLFGGSALVALSNFVRDRMIQQGRVVPAAIEQILEQGGDTDSETDTNVSQTEVRDVESTGGKIKNPFKKVGQAFSPKKINETFGKIGTAVNPITYVSKIKGATNLMRQSGQLTDKYLLPAAVSAGLPLYYGAAGTAGMMLGGPAGALAATKAADILWQEAVAKKGFDPRERQKSKVLGAISEKVGQAGAAQYKAGMSGKGYYLSPGMTVAQPIKKMSGGNLFVDMPDNAFIELIESLDINTLVQLLFSLASPQAAARRQMIVSRINRLRSQSPPPENVIPSGASGKGMSGTGYFLSPGMTVAQPTNKRALKPLSSGTRPSTKKKPLKII